MVVLSVAFLLLWLVWSLSNMPCSNLLLTSSPLHLLLLATSLQGSGLAGPHSLLQQVRTDRRTEPDIKLWTVRGLGGGSTSMMYYL